MSILVFGASSQIGHFLLPHLLAGDEPVLAVSRHPQPPQAGLCWFEGRLPDAVPANLPMPSAIFSFGPIGPFAQWLAGVRGGNEPPRVVATSSMSAQTKRDSAVPAERELSRALRDGEQALIAACGRLGAPWTILRPTLIYGAGLDKSLSPIARRARRTRLFPLPAGPGLRQPVHAEDLALAALAALDQPHSAGHILEIGGGERLTAGTMFRRVRASLHHATLPIPLPAWLLHAAQRVAPARLRGPLHRLDSDLVADNTELTRLLGIRPRAFEVAPDMWNAPR